MNKEIVDAIRVNIVSYLRELFIGEAKEVTNSRLGTVEMKRYIEEQTEMVSLRLVGEVPPESLDYYTENIAKYATVYSDYTVD
jgi:hypothetical protein